MATLEVKSAKEQATTETLEKTTQVWDTPMTPSVMPLFHPSLTTLGY
jgi:hypothetical protein